MAKAPATPQAPRPNWFPMPFPRKGIDRSVVDAELPELATTHSRNCRVRSPVTSKDGGDKRSGLPKLFTNQLTGEGGSTQINHIAVLPRTAAGEQTVSGLYAFKVSDDFVGQQMRELATGRNPSELATYPANDLAGFRRDYISGGLHLVSTFFLQRFNLTDLSATPDRTPVVVGTNAALVVDWKDSATGGGYPGVCVMYQTTNDLTIQMYAARKATVAGNGAGALGEPTGLGPFIRGSPLLDKYIGACLVRTGADTVRLDIIKVDGSTRTTLVSSDTFALTPSTWGSDDTQTNPDLFIRIYEQGGSIRAVCSWQSAGFGNAVDPSGVGGVRAGTFGSGMLEATPGTSGSGALGSAGATGVGASGGGGPGGSETPVLTCSTATTDFLGNNRGGIAALFTAGGAPADINDRWYVRSITYTKLVPPQPGVLNTCDRNSRPIIASRYFLPPQTTGVGITTAGVFQSAGGTEWHAVDDNLAGVIHPYIDFAYPFEEGNTAALRSSFVQISPIDPSYTGRPQVEVRGRVDGLTGIDTLGTDVEDVAGAALRLHSDLKSGILVEVMHHAGTEPNKPYQSSSRQDSYAEIRFVGLANGARFILDTFALATEHMPPFLAAQYQRWEDGGQNSLTALTVTWKIGGISLRVFTPSAMSGWAAFSTALSALTGRVAYMNTSKLCGICFRGDDAPPPTFHSWGGRIVDITLETQGQSVSEYEADVFVFLPGWIYKGSTAGGTASALPGGTGGALRNPLISTAYLGAQLFMADGSQTLYTGTSEFVGVAELVAGLYDDGTPMGIAPDGFRLLTAFQDRLVFASSRDNPTWWAMSRSGDPLDYDYGADPAESSAIFGANSSFGLPAEPITALITAPGDVLYIGGPSRISMIVGDPGLGGKLLLRTTKIGILGPRAWTFDDKNNLYFIGGAGGLWMIPSGSIPLQGTDPINVDRGRWGDEISKIDGSTHFVQLAFDPVERCIYILKSNVNKGIACTHFVYSLTHDAPLEDTYDGAALRSYMNPWACAQADTSVAAHRRLMMGMQDGYVRRFSDAVFYDEATDSSQVAIDASVDVYPSGLSQRVESMAHELQGSLDASAGALAAYWITGDSPGQVAALDESSAIATLALAAGYNTPQSIRARGGAHKLRLIQSSATLTMAIQELAAAISVRSRRR